MIITHDEYGEVEGVPRNSFYCGDVGSFWVKDGAQYHIHAGWREKIEEVWVEEAINLAIGCTTSLYETWQKDFRLRCVERYDLPDRWLELLSRENVYSNHALKQYKKTCLIAERKQSCQQQQN